MMRTFELSYNYDPYKNQLKYVTDLKDKTAGFVDANTGADDYSYDQNGNLTQDKNKKITSILYNYLNQPTEITFTFSPPKDGCISGATIKYVYDAQGNKLSKILTQQNSCSGNTTTVTDYAGGFVYRNNQPEFVGNEEGYYNFANGKYVYQFKDQLGDVNSSGIIEQAANEIVAVNNYYPFGLNHSSGFIENGNGNDLARKYKYNSKEYEDVLGRNVTEMDFRHYDNAIGRFNGVDLLAELTYSQTPYHFGNNNPNYWADPSGLKADSNGYGYYFDGEGHRKRDKMGFLIPEYERNSGGGELMDPFYLGSQNIFSTGYRRMLGSAPVSSEKAINTYGAQLLPEIVVQRNSSTWVSQIEQHVYEYGSAYQYLRTTKLYSTWNSVNNVMAPLNAAGGIFDAGIKQVGSAGRISTAQAFNRIATRTALNEAKALKAIGNVSLATNISVAAYYGVQFYNSPTAGNAARLGVQVLIIGAETGLNYVFPGLGVVAGVGLNIIEAQYGSILYDGLDSYYGQKSQTLVP